PAGEPPERTGIGWEVYPAGLGEVLDFVVSRTAGLPLYITENGAAYPDGSDPTRDPTRVNFLRRHLAVAHQALERGVPLRGYFVWSLLDNFEWAQGYGPRFGITHVNYESQERLVRDSGRFMGAVASSGQLPIDDEASAGSPPA
ncbi:MAG: family 1 glycosylhydrolase, partial [Candidatus Limnocylindrales bacterium]|nr:family 1 glycosylhydrolase [Candidatus Limnocylindrales bacterium]